MHFIINKQTVIQNYMQWIATCAMCLLVMQSGLTGGWITPNIARYIKNQSEIYLTPDEITWVSSTKELAGVFGAILGPLCVQFFGPKTAALTSFSAYFLSWTCLMVANSFVWLVIGRSISGIAQIGGSISFSIFLGEISNPKIRGTLIAIALSGNAPGTILAAFLETHFPPKICCPVYLTMCFVGMSLLIFVLPESPYFLGKSKNTHKTKKSISVYFPDEKIEEKLVSIQDFVKSQNNGSIRDQFKDIFGSAYTRKLMMITVLLSSLVGSSGLGNIERYMQTTLERANSYVINPENAIIYTNSVTFFLRLATCKLVDKLGRKFLFVMSSITSSVLLFILGLYFYFLDSNFFMENLTWIPITCMFLFTIFYSIGFYTTLFTILGEFCPPKAKNVSNCLSYLCRSIVSFVFAKIFLPVSYDFGEQYMFWIHALNAIIVVPVVLLLLPESKGKKLEDV